MDGKGNWCSVIVVAHSPMRVTSPLKLPIMTKKAARIPFSRSANLFRDCFSKKLTEIKVLCTHIGTAWFHLKFSVKLASQTPPPLQNGSISCT